MGFVEDVRYALRLMRRNPGFTAATMAILALGIGASASIFTLADAVLLRRLPVPDPGSLVLFRWGCREGLPAESFYGSINMGGEGRGSSGNAFSHPSFLRLRSEGAELVDFLAFAEVERLNVGMDGKADLATGMLVSGDYFSVLEVGTALGRPLTPADDRAGADPVAVLSDLSWSRRFGRDPSVLGRVLRLNGTPVTVVGVAPSGFYGTLDVGRAPDFFLPLSMQPQVLPGPILLDAPGSWWLELMGRRRPGVTGAQLAARLDPVLRQSVDDAHREEAERNALHLDLKSGARGALDSRDEFRTPIMVLGMMVGVLLLVTCANVATLVLSRANARRREVAVRLAIGAGRGRLIRQLLTESVLLAVAAGTVGFLLARLGEEALPAFLPVRGEPLVLDLAPLGPVLAFTLVLSVVTGLLFGLTPALRATRGGPVADLKDLSAGRGKNRFGSPGNLFVVVQVAMSLVLLVGGALFLRTLTNLERVDVGFKAEDLLLFRIDPTLNGYEGVRLADLYARILERIDALPGVRAATLSRHAPLAGSASISTVTALEGPSAGKKGSYAYVHHVRPNFLRTMEIPLLGGRDLLPEDAAGNRLVAVVNQAMARSFFAGANPVGKQLRLGSSPTEPIVEVVGLARDARYSRLRDENPPTMYVPYVQHPSMLGVMTFEVRYVGGDPAPLVDALRGVLAQADPNLPMFDVRTQAEQAARSLSQERQFSRLAACLAFCALLLASIGIYGTVSYAASRRTREIGIRMALGARRADVVAMVLREGLVLVVIGAAVGLVASLLGTRIVASFLYGLAPNDPAAFVLVSAILAGISLLAGYVPARRASRVDPAIALRRE